jgi:4-hydroxybenzoyl-CoA thioesterase/acyl-CoA thioester hydrolase
MSNLFVATRRVEFHQTDAAGIVHFAQFFLWMEQVEHEFFRHLGSSVVARYGDRTISWPRVACQCQFKRPLRFEQVVKVEFGVAELRRSSVRYRSRFLLDQDEVASGTMTSVCCFADAGGQFQSTPVPPPLREKLELYLLPPSQAD